MTFFEFINIIAPIISFATVWYIQSLRSNQYPLSDAALYQHVQFLWQNAIKYDMSNSWYGAGMALLALHATHPNEKIAEQLLFLVDIASGHAKLLEKQNDHIP